MTAEREPGCVERWPEAESGAYDPRCCRFPKSCSVQRVPVTAEPLDLGPIRERVEAATKGPWDAADEHGLMPNSEPAWCVSNVADDEVWLGDVFYAPQGHPQAQANSEFAAHARQDVPALLAEVDRLRAEIDDAWAACGGRDLAVTAEVSFGPAGSDLAVVEPSRQRTLGDFLRSVEQGARAREQAHRAALATARRDALNDAAEAVRDYVEGDGVATWLRDRAAHEEDR